MKFTWFAYMSLPCHANGDPFVIFLAWDENFQTLNILNRMISLCRWQIDTQNMVFQISCSSFLFFSASCQLQRHEDAFQPIYKFSSRGEPFKFFWNTSALFSAAKIEYLLFLNLSFQRDDKWWKHYLFVIMFYTVVKLFARAKSNQHQVFECFQSSMFS